MVEKGNPNSTSDGAVGALCARTAMEGAYLNIRTNVSGIKDEAVKSSILQKADKLMAEGKKLEKEIVEIAEGKIG